MGKEKMFNIGIMQGRLTKPNGRGIQFFPFYEWEKEFQIASRIGLDEIEWIFDYESYWKNPLWMLDGSQYIKKCIDLTGVRVNSICFDYFMCRPFYKADADKKAEIYKENFEVFKQILSGMKIIGANLIEIPLVDNSSISSKQEKEEVQSFLYKIARLAQEDRIEIGLEMDLPNPAFREFIVEINCKNIKANYDSGNSSGLGYIHQLELLSLNKLIRNVHIKDRALGGITKPLGTGNADFDELFNTLKQIKYQGSFILQAARTEDGREEENITGQIKFIKKYLYKYEF